MSYMTLKPISLLNLLIYMRKFDFLFISVGFKEEPASGGYKFLKNSLGHARNKFDLKMQNCTVCPICLRRILSSD